MLRRILVNTIPLFPKIMPGVVIDDKRLDILGLCSLIGGRIVLLLSVSERLPFYSHSFESNLIELITQFLPFGIIVIDANCEIGALSCRDSIAESSELHTVTCGSYRILSVSMDEIERDIELDLCLVVLYGFERLFLPFPPFGKSFRNPLAIGFPFGGTFFSFFERFTSFAKSFH